MKSQQVRDSYLNYFNKKGLPIIPSSSLIPHGDPTLLFTSAGMVQFKANFLGLKKDLKEAKDPRTVEAIQERLGKLTGKIGIIRVGGATPSDAEYTKLRVDDAVCAVRSAMRSGVLPGGGVALIRCKDVAHEFAEALEMPFKQLFSNAGLNAERYLAEIEKAHSWYGFDLNNISDKPQDMLSIGIVDPLEVIQEAVTNAATMAARLIRAKAAIITNDDAKLADNN